MDSIDTSSPSAALWSLVFVAVTWLGGRAWSYVSESRKADAKDRLDTIERWSRKAAAVVAPLITAMPQPLLAKIESLLTDEMRLTFKRIGLDLSDDEWKHAIEVAHEMLLTLQLRGLAAAAASVGKAMDGV